MQDTTESCVIKLHGKWVQHKRHDLWHSTVDQASASDCDLEAQSFVQPTISQCWRPKRKIKRQQQESCPQRSSAAVPATPGLCLSPTRVRITSPAANSLWQLPKQGQEKRHTRGLTILKAVQMSSKYEVDHGQPHRHVLQHGQSHATPLVGNGQAAYCRADADLLAEERVGEFNEQLAQQQLLPQHQQQGVREFSLSTSIERNRVGYVAESLQERPQANGDCCERGQGEISMINQQEGISWQHVTVNSMLPSIDENTQEIEENSHACTQQQRQSVTMSSALRDGLRWRTTMEEQEQPSSQLLSYKAAAMPSLKNANSHENSTILDSALDLSFPVFRNQQLEMRTQGFQQGPSAEEVSLVRRAAPLTTESRLGLCEKRKNLHLPASLAATSFSDSSSIMSTQDSLSGTCGNVTDHRSISKITTGTDMIRECTSICPTYASARDFESTESESGIMTSQTHMKTISASNEDMKLRSAAVSARQIPGSQSCRTTNSSSSEMTPPLGFLNSSCGDTRGVRRGGLWQCVAEKDSRKSAAVRDDGLKGSEYMRFHNMLPSGCAEADLLQKRQYNTGSAWTKLWTHFSIRSQKQVLLSSSKDKRNGQRSEADASLHKFYNNSSAGPDACLDRMRTTRCRMTRWQQIMRSQRLKRLRLHKKEKHLLRVKEFNSNSGYSGRNSSNKAIARGNRTNSVQSMDISPQAAYMQLDTALTVGAITLSELSNLFNVSGILAARKRLTKHISGGAKQSPPYDVSLSPVTTAAENASKKNDVSSPRTRYEQLEYGTVVKVTIRKKLLQEYTTVLKELEVHKAAALQYQDDCKHLRAALIRVVGAEAKLKLLQSSQKWRTYIGVSIHDTDDDLVRFTANFGSTIKLEPEQLREVAIQRHPAPADTISKVLSELIYKSMDNGQRLKTTTQSLNGVLIWVLAYVLLCSGVFIWLHNSVSQL